MTALTEATLALADLATINPRYHYTCTWALRYNTMYIYNHGLQLRIYDIYTEWDWSRDCGMCF